MGLGPPTATVEWSLRYRSKNRTATAWIDQEMVALRCLDGTSGPARPDATTETGFRHFITTNRDRCHCEAYPTRIALVRRSRDFLSECRIQRILR
jgi:hypothetical protein